MSETRNDAAPNGEPEPADSTTAAPAPVGPEDVAALNGHAGPTDDTPTIISRTGPHHHKHEEPAGGLRGRKLAHFELIEPIGVGGMAAVIRARDTQLDRLVALKILPPDMASDPENVRRFHQEARSAARLDHENVARVFFCGEDQSLFFIAFEFVEGDNLRTILERRGRLPVAEALHYILQVAAGLAHAAQRGVVHRDIKPSNIIITPTGRAKLVDMGLARSMERQDDQGLTQSGVTLGTFDYISPEQALEPREADVRSDIYSLGCTLYHVLTGRPPVPDGTAAKKLHHHQHIKPRDPRELVPGLPDEVAVILDRMMAKRPQDRYQSPEQLVHHLLLAARKLGGPSNVPEGVLSVEAALPPPPGGRPLLLAGLAAALVVLLIVALEVFNRPPPTAAGAGQVANAQETPKPDASGSNIVKPPAVVPGPSPPGDGNPNPPAQPPPPLARYDDRDGKDLREWLRDADKNAPKEIVLSNDVDLLLPQNRDTALELAGPRVTIQAALGKHPTIRFTHRSEEQGTNPWVGVSIDSPKVKISGVRFVVDGRDSDVRMVGLRLHAPAGEPTAFNVDNCEFIQAQPRAGGKRLASLDAATEARPANLNLTGCRFLSFMQIRDEGKPTELFVNDGAFGGDDAVLREGPVDMHFFDCAFGPHGADFRLEGGMDAAAPTLTLDHCSVLSAGASAVFDVQRDGAVDLRLQANLFSHPDAPDRGAGSTVLVRQDNRGDVSCTDRGDNHYHGLDAFRVIGDDRQSWAAFQTWAGAESSTFSASADSPWSAADPLQLLQKYNLKKDLDDQLAAAFRIKAASPGLRLAAKRELPVGVETLGGVSFVEALAEADRQAQLALEKRRIVEPHKDDSAHRIYGTLDEALSAAQPGDTILLRWDGVQRIDPIRLGNDRLREVTIRPDDNCHPQLLLTASKDLEPAMFRVYDGTLRLERLEFVLRPQGDFHRQAVIDLVGQGQCEFKNCVVTLDRAGQPPGTRLAVVWLSDPAKAMMPTRPADHQAPRLSLEGCLVRGDGDLVACQLSRPLTLDATNTLTALKGSFLSIDDGAPAPAADGAQMTLTLKRVTTYLAGNLIRLRAKDAPNLTPIHCAPTDCLFVAASKEPLILVDDPSLDERDLHDKVAWEGGRSVYANYVAMLDETAAPDLMPNVSGIGPDKWLGPAWDKNTGSKQLKSLQYGFEKLPGEVSFFSLTPMDFRSPDPTDCGADVDALNQDLAPMLPK